MVLTEKWPKLSWRRMRAAWSLLCSVTQGPSAKIKGCEMVLVLSEPPGHSRHPAAHAAHEEVVVLHRRVGRDEHPGARVEGGFGLAAM